MRLRMGVVLVQAVRRLRHAEELPVRLRGRGEVTVVHFDARELQNPQVCCIVCVVQSAETATI